jgi:putative PIN family toxin of toxin-antitoxin system
MIVIDTNVLVSALLTPDGTCARVINWALANPPHWLVTFAMLDEYGSVLHHPRFGFDECAINNLVGVLAGSAFEDVPPVPVSVRNADRYDKIFYSTAVRYGAQALVTGNRKHFPMKPEVPVLTPRQFIEFTQRGRYVS